MMSPPPPPRRAGRARLQPSAPARPPRLARAVAGAALVPALLHAAPLRAHVGVVPRPAAASLAAAGFPEPFGAALLAMVAAGALGAVAADLVPDGRRLERWKRGEQGWLLRALGKMIVGTAAAVILLTLNPPAGAWAPLIGSALIAGLGGEALLVSVVSARKAADAERDREALRAELARRRAEVVEKVESIGELAIAAYRSGRVIMGRGAFAGLDDGDEDADLHPPFLSP
ncbi:MAG TPA: hypothetical protein VFR81_04660, partial [Longimicrobium sp.]|nr:hypothetical protein [Longimicrobium sp.]